MKKLRSLLILSLLVSFFAVSCDKKEDNAGNGYAPTTPEQDKTALENVGLDMLNQMETLQDEEVFSLIEDLASAFNGEEINGFKAPKEITTTLLSLKGNNAQQLTANFKSLAENITLQDEWENVTGTYTIDFDNDSVFYSETPSDAVIIILPGSSAVELTGDVKLTVENVSFSAITAPYWESLDQDIQDDLDELPTDIPSSVDVLLNYDGTDVLTFSYTGTFQADGMPTMISAELAMGSFALYEEFTHTPFSKATEKYGFRNGDLIIWEAYGEVGGNWSSQNVDANTYEVTETDDWGSYTYTEVEAEEIFQNANASFQILDVKLVGNVNFKALGDAIRAWQDANPYPNYNDYETYEEYEAASAAYDEVETTKMIEILNSNASLYLAYSNGTGIIAKAELYPVEDEDCWTNYEYNYDTEQYEPFEYCETYWDLAMNLVFADGSKVDAEVYFTENFTDVFDSYVDFLSDVESTFDY